jgi:hypothetical protein
MREFRTSENFWDVPGSQKVLSECGNRTLKVELEIVAVQRAAEEASVLEAALPREESGPERPVNEVSEKVEAPIQRRIADEAPSKTGPPSIGKGVLRIHC